MNLPESLSTSVILVHWCNPWLRRDLKVREPSPSRGTVPLSKIYIEFLERPTDSAAVTAVAYRNRSVMMHFVSEAYSWCLSSVPRQINQRSTLPARNRGGGQGKERTRPLTHCCIAMIGTGEHPACAKNSQDDYGIPDLSSQGGNISFNGLGTERTEFSANKSTVSPSFIPAYFRSPAPILLTRSLTSRLLKDSFGFSALMSSGLSGSELSVSIIASV